MVVPAPAFDTENILGCPTHMDANFSSAFCRHQQGQRPGPRANDQDIEIAGFGDFFLKICQTGRPAGVGRGN